MIKTRKSWNAVWIVASLPMVMMNAAAPGGAPPRRISDYKHN